MQNRFDMIPGRNVKSVNIRRWKAEVPFVSHLSIMDSTRTSLIETRFVRFWAREIKWDVRFHVRDNNFCYAFSTKRWISNTEAVIIPWQTRIVPPQSIPLS